MDGDNLSKMPDKGIKKRIERGPPRSTVVICMAIAESRIRASRRVLAIKRKHSKRDARGVSPWSREEDARPPLPRQPTPRRTKRGPAEGGGDGRDARKRVQSFSK